MGLEKAEMRAAGIHDVGVRMDDLLEASRKEVVQCEGASLGLLQAVKAVNDLNPHVDKDVDEGKFDLETAKLIKLYLGRASQATQNLAQNARNQQMIAAGRVQAFETSVAVTKKMYDAESQRAAAIAEAESDPANMTLRSRPAGVHPPRTLKEMRLAEEGAGQVQEVTLPASETATSIPEGVAVTTSVVDGSNLSVPTRKKPGPKPKIKDDASYT